MSPSTISATALKYPIFLPSKGPELDKPKEFLQDIISPYSRNMELLNELVQGRGGMAKLVGTQLSGYILSQPFLNKFNGNRFNLCCTPKDIYSLDYTNTRFDILTPTYTTGTIEIQAGTPTILRGSGTSWNANAKAGDYVKIGAGSIHTGSTWYEVDSVDSDTLITLTSAAATTAAGTAYVLRKIFAGGNTNYWDWEQILDTNQGEVVIMTNGIDTPVYWKGSGQVVALSGLATGFTASRYVDVYKDRVLFLDNTEGGGRQPQRERWSGVADLTSWTDIDFRDFVDEPTFITGTARFAGFHVVFKEGNAYIGRHISGDDVFDYDLAPECEGCRSRFSIIEKKAKFLAYYGSDKKIHAWNLLKDIIITEAIFPETKEFDPNTDEFVQGFEIKVKNQMRWFCPSGSTSKFNYIIVWDYAKQDVKVWDTAEEDALSSMGRLFLSDDVYADDPVFGELFADETSGFADDSSLLANAAITLYGGYDGYLRIADSGNNDDGSEFTRLLRFKRLNFKLSDRRKRLNRQRWWLDQESSGSVTIKIKLDENSSYEAETKSISLVEAGKEVIKKMVTWDLHAITFQPEISATNFFALHGFNNYFFLKGLG